MGLLALLAVFAGEADRRATAGSSRSPTAILFALFTWQWYQVQRIDDRATGRRPRGTSPAWWSAVVADAGERLRRRRRRGRGSGRWSSSAGWSAASPSWRPTDTEGFGEGRHRVARRADGLFTIIVLGEVVVGVVGGISDAEDADATTIATGMIGLTIGMGMWWNYFVFATWTWLFVLFLALGGVPSVGRVTPSEHRPRREPAATA